MPETEAPPQPPLSPSRRAYNVLRKSGALLGVVTLGFSGAAPSVNHEGSPSEPGLEQPATIIKDEASRFSVDTSQATASASSSNMNDGMTLSSTKTTPNEPKHKHKEQHEPKPKKPKHERPTTPESKHHKKPQHPIEPLILQKPAIGGPATPITPTAQVQSGIGGPATPEKSPPPPLALNGANLDNGITPDIESLMQQNAVYIPALGCSGWLLRDENGLPVGMITATHCLKLSGNLSTDADGQFVFNEDQPMRVYVSDTVGGSTTPNAMMEAGVIKSFYSNVTPTDGLLTNDVTIVEFDVPGIDMDSVVQIAQNQFLFPQDIVNLPQGSTVLEAGFPQDDSGDDAPVALQSLAMSVLGNSTWTVNDSNGNAVEQLPLLITGVSTNQAGFVCSRGISGSLVFVYNSANGSAQFVGVNTAFNLLAPVPTAGDLTQANLQDLESQYNVQLTGYSADCGVSYMLPSASSSSTIPVAYPNDPESAGDAFEDQLLDDFFNPDYPRQYIKGLVYINADGIKPGWVKDPVYAYDPASNTLLIATYNPSSSTDPTEHLQVTIISNASTAIQNFSVFSDDGQTLPSLASSMGSIEAPNPNDMAFTDQNGNTFGDASLPGGDIAPTNTGATLIINDSQQVQLNEPSNGVIPVANPNPETPVPVSSGQ